MSALPERHRLQSAVLGLSDTSEELLLQHCCLWIRWREAKQPCLSDRLSLVPLDSVLMSLKKKVHSCFALCILSYCWTITLISGGAWESPFHSIQSK